MFKQICQKWFTPHVDLFATHLNHKVSLYVSPVLDQNAWDIDARNINSSGLTAYAYPVLLLGPSAALNRDPSPVTSVNTSQTVPQPCVLQQSTTSQCPDLVSRSAQLQE